MEIVVDPAVRAQGIGPAVINEFLNKAAVWITQPINVFEAVIVEGNTASQISFYKTGFVRDEKDKERWRRAAEIDEILFRYTAGALPPVPPLPIRWLGQEERRLFNAHLRLCGQNAVSIKKWNGIIKNGRIPTIRTEKTNDAKRKTMNPYEIKQININDYPACAAVFGGNCPFAETCLRQQKAGIREVYALFADGEIAAECHLVYDNPEYGTVPGRRAYLSRMATRKECRRKGYGTKIARFILDLAKEKGYKEIALGVNCDNTPALHLYQRLGFSVYETAQDDYGEYYRMEKRL